MATKTLRKRWRWEPDSRSNFFSPPAHLYVMLVKNILPCEIRKKSFAPLALITSNTIPLGVVKSRMCPPYPHACRKRRLNGAVTLNNRLKRVAPLLFLFYFKNYLGQMYPPELEIKRHDGEQHFCFLLGFTPVNR